MGTHQTLHGDGVKDIAFAVEDCRALYKVDNICLFTHTYTYIELIQLRWLFLAVSIACCSCYTEGNRERSHRCEGAVGGDRRTWNSGVCLS